MVIQHNLCAINTAIQFGLVSKAKAKTTEKLASGYRINRSADDAAGLAISEKIRRQIRGLTQASSNAQDGISMVQTAEGAMNEVHDILHRMNELCIKAANGTETSIDRSYIQSEISALSSELDRIGDTTTFNELPLLKGLPPASVTPVMPNISGVGASITSASGNSPAYYDIGALNTGDIIGIENSAGNMIYYNVNGVSDGSSVYDGTSPSSAYNASAAQVYDLIASALLRANSDQPDVEQVATNYSTGADAGRYSIEFYGPLHATLQVGAESGQTIDVLIDALNAASLGVRDLDVYDENNIPTSILQVKSAIETVSRQRSDLGAIQNRLEHTINNLNNVVENTTSAESKIRDTDMASQMVLLSMQNILSQAGQAMLSQANQLNSGVLSLLG